MIAACSFAQSELHHYFLLLKRWLAMLSSESVTLILLTSFTEDDYDDYHKVQLRTEMSWDSETWFLVSWKVFTDSTASLQFLRTNLRKYDVYNNVVARKKSILANFEKEPQLWPAWKM